MKVVIIYGPPGVGKLTVGKRLAKKTGFRLLHVHLIADAILSLFPYGSKEFCPLMEKMRLEFMKAAAESRRIAGVILTGVYSPTTQIDLSEKLIRRLSKIARVKVLLVRLNCSEQELYKRVTHPSRRLFKKIHEKGPLKYLLKNFRFDVPLKFKESLAIDNTKLSAERCARRIKRQLGL